ncbi:hypothetical protein ACLB2K_025661 [Fragaria x ananassa]
MEDGEDETKLSIPVTLAAVTGIGNPIREAVAFSPPILFQQRSSMKADTTVTLGTTMRSSGHRLDAERRSDDGGAIGVAVEQSGPVWAVFFCSTLLPPYPFPNIISNE